MGNKVAFLFGAGISDPRKELGLTTTDLTKKILDCRSEAQSFTVPAKELERVKMLFDILKIYFHSSLKEPNYEDYYYLLETIDSHILKEYENP